jgi:hypothetical protein
MTSFLYSVRNEEAMSSTYFSTRKQAIQFAHDLTNHDTPVPVEQHEYQYKHHLATLLNMAYRQGLEDGQNANSPI